MTDIIACRLGEADLAARSAAIQAQWAGRLVRARELPDGYVFDFIPDSDIPALLDEFIAIESACCPFFRFARGVEDGFQTLALSGGPGVKEFIHDTFVAEMV